MRSPVGRAGSLRDARPADPAHFFHSSFNPLRNSTRSRSSRFVSLVGRSSGMADLVARRSSISSFFTVTNLPSAVIRCTSLLSSDLSTPLTVFPSTVVMRTDSYPLAIALLGRTIDSSRYSRVCLPTPLSGGPISPPSPSSLWHRWHSTASLWRRMSRPRAASPPASASRYLPRSSLGRAFSYPARRRLIRSDLLFPAASSTSSHNSGGADFAATLSSLSLNNASDP